MTQLDMLSWSPPTASTPEPRKRPSIEERWQAFNAANPHVFAEALRIARTWLARGDRYISVKAIFETLRTSVSTTGEGGRRLNNDMTAPLSRALIAAEPRLVGVIELRTRRAK